MMENNQNGLCGKCGQQLEGQSYDWLDDLLICQKCRLEIIDHKMMDLKNEIDMLQVWLKDLRRRREKVSKGEVEFYSSQKL